MRLPALFAALLVLLVLPGCERAAAPEPSVENAWIRMPAVAGRPGVAYFTIRGGNETLMLESVGSPQIEKIELHDSAMEDGMMRMGPLEDRNIPAGAALVFEPGGRHAMLFGMAGRIAPGGEVPLHFRFGGGTEAKAVATVVAAGDGAPDHGGH